MCSSKNLLIFVAVFVHFVKLLKDISLMRKILFTLLCAFSALFFLPNAVVATDYTIFPDADVASYALPLSYFHQTYAGSITQQIYWAEELTDQGATAGSINSITFYYTAAAGTTASAYSRNIQIYLMEIDNTTDEYTITKPSYDWVSSFLHDNSTKKAGTKVYEGALSTQSVTASNPINLSTDVKSVTIPISAFPWNGSKNIVMTIADVTNTVQSSANLRFLIASTKISSTSYPRFAYTKWTAVNNERLDWIDDFSGNKYADKYGYTTTTYNTEDGQKSQRSYVNKVTFSISAPVVPSVPEDLAASSIGSTSASLSWSAVDGATSYDLYNSTSIDGVYSKFASPTTNSFEWSGLTANTTYYVKVAAVNDAGSSALSDPIYFTTLAPHIHDGITFEPWSNPAALPTSGNYFLNTDVELASDWNVTENINLCLNGHEVYTETNSIQVKDGATFAIYDNEGGGRIYGYFVANYPKYGLINIENGGTLVLSEGTIQNLYGSYEEDDDPDDKSLSNAIYNNGTLKLSGALTFTSYHADIYLGSNKYITIESEKPLTNSEPYSVYKSGKSVITSGWANMNGADPKDYFVSANTSLNIKMGETEAEFYPVISLSENNTNTAIGTYSGQMVDVNLTRSLTSSQFNTFCLPFALDDDRLQELFGAGYDLEEFVSSSLEGDVLSLEFSKVTSLEAGKPYLLQPSVDVANPSFEGVTIAVTAPVDQTSDANISFYGTFAPTELAGGNENLLFLGVGNELFWPEATGNLKAFRAYFEVKGGAAKVAKRARIVQKGEQTQAIDLVENPNAAHKRIIDGQLVIEKNGMLFNAQGQMVK